MKLFEIEQPDLPENCPSPKPLKDLDDAISLIQKNCSEYLSMIDNDLLWHGWSNNVPDLFQSHTVPFRQPRNTGSSLEMQEYIDTILKYRGMSALRSNSLYCMGSMERVEQFGKVHAIYPFNGFDFTWVSSPMLGTWGRTPFWPYKFWYNYSDNDAIDKIKFTNKNLNAALSSGTEILIKGSFVSVDSKFVTLLNNRLNIK